MAVADAIVAVRGCASADVDPELARVIVGISAREKDRLAAVEALAKADASVWSVLGEYAGAVERSRSDGVQVWSEAERAAKASKAANPNESATQDAKPGKSKRAKRAGPVLGYAAQVWYEITVGDFTVLDEMLSALADQPGVELAGPSWALRTDSGVYRKLRAEAVRQARVRAEECAAAAGGTLSGLIELADDGIAPASYDEIAIAKPEGSRDGEARASWVIQPARQSVSVTVHARFSMSQPYFA